MRVLMLSWEYPPKVIGGLGQHVDALCAALKHHRINVTLVTNSNDGPEEERDGTLRVVRVREHFPPARSFTESVVQGNTALLQGALSAARNETFDVVHAHDWLTAYAARAVKHALKIPLVATIHATEWGRNRGLFNDQQKHISDIEWWLSFEAWRVICCSDAMERELRHIFQIPADKIDVIPNGVHVPKDNGAVSPLRDEDHETKIVFVGRLVYEKGVDLLLQAFKELTPQHPSAVLYVAGRGPEEAALKDYSWRLGIESKVKFLGYITDHERNRLYQEADAVVVPSRYEPFGIVALEAMAYGAPVVAAGTGGLAEVIDHNRTGLLFSPGNARDLSEQLIRIISAPDLRRKITREADALIRDRYDWHSIARQTLSVYREVVDASSGVLDRPAEIITS